MHGFQGRIVAVVGATGGIGEAICRRFASAGATIAAVARQEGKLAHLDESLASEGWKVFAVLCNATDPDDVKRAVTRITGEVGRVDVLVNCVGKEQVMPFSRISDKELDDLLAVNLKATLLVTREIGRTMIADGKGGSVVNVASMAGWIGMPGAVVYGAAKAAIAGATRCLALEWAKPGIRVNAVLPGYVRTPMFERLAAKLGPGQVKLIEEAHPLGLGHPSDVAAAVAFLASDEARWITGTSLFVDGGYSIR